MTILTSSITSHEINANKNQFQNRIDFSQSIDYVESMLGVLKSLNIWAQFTLQLILSAVQAEITLITEITPGLRGGREGGKSLRVQRHWYTLSPMLLWTSAGYPWPGFCSRMCATSLAPPTPGCHA
jgi:hypothetical protein